MAKKPRKSGGKQLRRSPSLGSRLRDLGRKVDALRRRAKRGLSRTAALERLIRAGLEKEQAQVDLQQ